jgi:hypothetical protein
VSERSSVANTDSGGLSVGGAVAGGQTGAADGVNIARGLTAATETDDPVNRMPSREDSFRLARPILSCSTAETPVPLAGLPEASVHPGPGAVRAEPGRFARRGGRTGIVTRSRGGSPGTLRTIRGDKDPRRAGARHRFPVRRLHLVDIENLAGDPQPSLGQVRQVRGLYADCLAFGAMDQVEVAASSRRTLENAAFGWPRVHYRARYGPDGADLALVDVLRHEDVAGRFTHVVIGSGDHLFAEEAARLAAQGVWVTVVSRWRSLSAQLAREAHEVIYLDTAAEAA